MIKSKKKLIFLFIILSAFIYFAFTFQGNKNFKLSEPDQLSNLNKVEFFDSEGLKYNISDFSGKIILINFWATWCLPCRAEMPSLDNLQRKIGDDTFQVIIVAIERTSYSKIANFLDEIDIKILDALKKNPPDAFFIYSSRSAKNLFNLINKYSLLNIVTHSNLMCISEKVLSVLKQIKWKKEFVFSPGEEEFLLNKIR